MSGYYTAWFDSLIQGNLPDGYPVKIYSIDDVSAGKVKDPFGQYGVAFGLPDGYLTSQSGPLKKKAFMENPFAISRAGTMEYLNEYFDKEASEYSRNHEVRIYYPYAYISSDHFLISSLVLGHDEWGLISINQEVFPSSFVAVPPEVKI
jgi:hypothetical protein